MKPGMLSAMNVVALVESGEWWVEANFRETDLTRIRAGQPARVEIDMYPDVVLKGTVASLSAGSGAASSGFRSNIASTVRNANRRKIDV